MTIAAPGEDILPLDDPELNLSTGQVGTSFSAPMVASIAAILQSIRSAELPMPPSQLRSILTSTATTITGQWDPDRDGQSVPMARLNALAAVEAVLPLDRSDAVYVADRKALGTGTQPGTVVVVNVDPITGTPAAGPGATTTIDLTLRQGGRTLQIGGPVSLLTSRDGGRLYVFASAPDPFGDGIAIVDGTSRRTLAFVPLSGTPFPLPADVSARPPFRNYLPRPPIALSRDGRLLYVATGHWDSHRQYPVRQSGHALRPASWRLQHAGPGSRFAPGAPRRAGAAHRRARRWDPGRRHRFCARTVA